AELSALAAATLEAAIRFHARRLAARHGPPAGHEADPPGAGFCAIAMGKLGARELNFSSDVDLLFVYDRDGTTAGERPIANFAWYAKLAELVTESLALPTEDGFVFRVDLDLRPDGQNGPIVNSVHAAELYYGSFGRTWERAALVKARPAAGDRAVGEALLAALEPFVWRRSLDLGALSEIHGMKRRIDARAGAEGRDDLKLGRGGIREVEFFVTALQLLHGGRPGAAALRERSVLAALDRLLFAGVVPARDRDALADAYLFLRRAEHRVQMLDGAQTHRLPPPEERDALARAMGLPGAAELEAALAGHRDRVAALFADLLGAGSDAPPLDPELALLADAEVERPRRVALAAGRGLVDPERSVAALEILARRRTPFAPGADPGPAVALLADALGTPDPDQALSGLADFAAALHDPEPWFRLLADHRRVARLLLSLFGTSDFLSKRFLRHPELLDVLLREDVATLEKGRATLEAELAERLAALDATDGARGADERIERRLGELRRWHGEELLRIAIHDIAGTIDLASVATQLTSVAELAVARCLALAEEEATAKGRLPPGRLCVVGMGKLGGRELGYHSDLDLVFLHPSVAAEARGLFSRLAQRLLAFLQMPLREGRLYAIDTRLRPSGNQGALVASADAFARYHAGEAQLWERQALLRARPVAGDAALLEGIRPRLHEVVFGTRTRPDDRAALAAGIRRMRERIEAELAAERTRGRNPKTGRGGLVDVEFAAQFLQLLHGHAHPAVRTPTTPVALARLRDEGLLADPEHAALAEGYAFLRRVELRLRIVHDFPIAHLPSDGPALAQLARRLGFHGDAPGAAFLAEYERVTTAVRAAFDAVVR
ncbi:MAG TPA: bifunctional [glutamate--ammonia ligase]-adenylyl-L-tyrosine phosphorylase/[glutamate--ammonia-ligase] adenylyltransferase, partial [Anaeromyxobacteraceae bacterium]|nr:bifunctional [glutamate--ammonia ligase]-adenylyl-L-tyrosine phosphorylase/[glutamate--ammonia-ligase] adenylyltransferase [Anaeromyxobacteraceae bacterium]